MQWSNCSDIPRIGIAIRYVSTRVRQEGVDKPIATLVRGRDDHHHFRLLAAPTDNDAVAGEGRHALLLSRARLALAGR